MSEEDDARRLAEERRKARGAGDFARADVLRGRIARLGFSVADTPDGYELAASAPDDPGPAPRLAPDEVPSALNGPADRDWTVHWIADGWPQDVLRGIASFRLHEGSRIVQHVVAEAEESETRWPSDVEVIRLREGLGWARARNAGLRRTRGTLAMIVDGSVEAEGDVFGPLEAALEDRAAGITGPFGVVTDDLRTFHPAAGGACDAVEAYLMAFRRDLLVRGLRFLPAFRFYRAADIDLSFQVKDLGFGASVTEVAVRRHEHRRWAATSPEDRDRLSRRNFYAFLDRWRGRMDLTVAGQEGSPGTGATPEDG